MNIPLKLNQFVEALIDKSNLESEQIIEQVRKDISARLEAYIILKMAFNLNEENKNELFEMIEAFPRSFDPYDYLNSHIKNLDQKIEEVLPEFRNSYLTRK